MKKIIILIVALYTIISCKSKEEVSSNNTQFYESYVNQNITPALNTFLKEITAEKNAIDAFKKNPSLNHFKEIQKYWLTAAISFEKINVYNFGQVKNDYYSINLYNFPIETSKIENLINTKSTFNNAFFTQKSSTVKGLGTLEYLLYNNDENKAFDLLTKNSKRIDYMVGVGSYTKDVAEKLKNFWLDKYKTTFINANASSCIKNRMCLSFNQLINVLDVSRVTKIGKPCGFEKTDNVNVALLEAFRSKNSLTLIKSSLEEVQKAYLTGNTNFHILVDEIDKDAKITSSIKTAFDDTFIAIKNLDNNLNDAILKNPESVRPIYNPLKKLVTILSTDVTSLLSVNTLPTDNDGD